MQQISSAQFDVQCTVLEADNTHVAEETIQNLGLPSPNRRDILSEVLLLMIRQTSENKAQSCSEV